MEKRKQIDHYALYTLCNKEKLFTCGSSEQYSKMFELAKNGITRHELAYILYLCSNCKLDIIFGMIAPLFKN